MNICLESTLELAIVWAKEVGEVQRSYFRGGHLDIETKSTVHDVVTKVDKLSESMLLERIGKHFPDHSVLGEESGEHDLHSDYLWVIDPLDGTNNYSQGLPVYTVSIGLQYRGETVLGVVYAPYMDELYTAIRGKGAFLNGKPIRVAAKTDLDQSVLATGFPYDKGINPINNIDNLSRILSHLRGIRRMGSAAYDLCCVAAGFLDGYWELGLKLWDVCAGVLIVQEAGGTIEHFRYDRGIAIMTANPQLLQRIKEYIR
ncbi:inositol monophosphatase family protein [Butyricimonas synergistica]|uniref:inositol monophosphatase family protein n=1 Tax=Butyricimonas synergistica TaxID=544644 RepID=UPI0003752E8F|nr:inositol monophosphatase family protein [Butyricimonas synergistica]